MIPTQPDGSSETIGLIGGIGLSEVHVYAQRKAPDGKFSGCPHVHAVTDEAYFVLQGSGAVEFHDLVNGFRVLPLAVGQYVHFPPMVMHRLISDGDLVILGLMGAGGLPERGEARIYFGAAVDSDPRRFEDLLSLPRRLGLEGALQRRDASVQAYQHLMKLCGNDRNAYVAELRRFFAVHCAAMAGRAEELLAAVQSGPLECGRKTLHRIRQLPGVPEIQSQIQFNRRTSDGEPALGMCGVLRPILSLQTLSGPP